MQEPAYFAWTINEVNNLRQLMFTHQTTFQEALAKLIELREMTKNRTAAIGQVGYKIYLDTLISIEILRLFIDDVFDLDTFPVDTEFYMLGDMTIRIELPNLYYITHNTLNYEYVYGLDENEMQEYDPNVVNVDMNRYRINLNGTSKGEMCRNYYPYGNLIRRNDAILRVDEYRQDSLVPNIASRRLSGKYNSNPYKTFDNIPFVVYTFTFSNRDYSFKMNKCFSPKKKYHQGGILLYKIVDNDNQVKEPWENSPYPVNYKDVVNDVFFKNKLLKDITPQGNNDKNLIQLSTYSVKLNNNNVLHDPNTQIIVIGIQSPTDIYAFRRGDVRFSNKYNNQEDNMIGFMRGDVKETPTISNRNGENELDDIIRQSRYTRDQSAEHRNRSREKNMVERQPREMDMRQDMLMERTVDFVQTVPAAPVNQTVNMTQNIPLFIPAVGPVNTPQFLYRTQNGTFFIAGAPIGPVPYIPTITVTNANQIMNELQQQNSTMTTSQRPPFGGR